LLSEALCGCKFLIEHLDGRILCIQNEGSIISPSDVKIIKGEGMPILDSSQMGNLFIKFNVVFPDDLTADQKSNILNILPSDPSLIYDQNTIPLISL
jgi:DnaJ-class molecular chaperone